MIDKWYNTIIPEAASMIDIDDEAILNMSSGEVNSTSDLDDSKDTDRTLTDPTIFGNLKDMNNNMKMGHITLAVPIINVQYFKGRKPVLAGDLGMEMKDIDDILNCFKYVVIAPVEGLFYYKQVLSVKEYNEAKTVHRDDKVMALTGPAAIAALLEADNTKDRQYMVLNYLPVLPLQVRYQKAERNGKITYIPTMLNVLYVRVISCNNRIARLKELNAAEILLQNEIRLLQNTVDQLISNGARRTIFCHDRYLTPADSLDEVYEYTTRMTFKELKRYTCHIDKKAVLEAYRQYQDYYLELDKGELECDDPRILKLEELSSVLDQAFESFVNKYVDEIHPRYSDFKKIIFKGVIREMQTTVGKWLCPVVNTTEDDVEYDCIYKEDNERSTKVLNDMCDRLEHGITECIDLYISKQLKWNI